MFVCSHGLPCADPGSFPGGMHCGDWSGTLDQVGCAERKSDSIGSIKRCTRWSRDEASKNHIFWILPTIFAGLSRTQKQYSSFAAGAQRFGDCSM